MQETQETRVWYVGREDPLEKEMATHSSIFAWKIPWTEEPGGLQSLSLKESDMAEHTRRSPFVYCCLWLSHFKGRVQ